MKINRQQLEKTVKKINEKTFNEDKCLPDEIIKHDLEVLQKEIQNLVNKYDASIELYYDDIKQVHVSINLRV